MTLSSTGMTDEAGMWNGSLTLLTLLSYLQQMLLPFPSLHYSTLNSMAPAAVITCQLLPITRINACAFQVSLANVPEMQYRAAYQTVFHGQLTIHDVFDYMAISHLMYLTQPSKMTLTKEKINALGVCLSITTGSICRQC